jgi:drug/metabolite transporter (DMT)-like permease
MLNSWKKSWILMIPAALYSLTNWLAFKSLTYLDASDFQLLAQGKVLSNAGFAVLMLGVKLNKIQWTALSILAFGLALSELSKRSQIEHASSKQIWIESHDQKWIGSLFVGVIVLVNGFIGTFHEKYIKDLNSTSIFVINAQVCNFVEFIFLDFFLSSSAFFFSLHFSP